MTQFANITTSPNKHLSNLASITRNFGFVGKYVCTPVQSSFLAGALIKEDQKSLFETLQQISAARASVGEIQTSMSEDAFAILSYALIGWCSQTDVLAATLEGGQLAALKPKERVTRKVANSMELLEEWMISLKLFTAANWGAQTAAASAKFDAVGADPVKIINNEAREKVYGWEKSAGSKLVALFGRDAWNVYRTNDKVRSAFQSAFGGAMAREMAESDRGPAATAAQQYAAAQLEVDEVHVGRAQVKDGAGNRVDLWGDNVLIAVVNDDPEIDSGAAAHMLWWGDKLRRTYEEFTHQNLQFPDGATMIKVASSFLPKIINTDGGFLLTDVKT